MSKIYKTFEEWDNTLYHDEYMSLRDAWTEARREPEERIKRALEVLENSDFRVHEYDVMQEAIAILKGEE